MRPQPTEKEIQFILDAISEYLTVKVSPVVAADPSMHGVRLDRTCWHAAAKNMLHAAA